MNKNKLSEIATIIMGQSPKSIAYNNGGNGIPFMQGKTTFGHMYPYIDTWTTEWNKEALPNDILFTVRAPVGDVNICNKKIAIGRGLAAIRSINVNYRYLYYLQIKQFFLIHHQGQYMNQLIKIKLKMQN